MVRKKLLLKYLTQTDIASAPLEVASAADLGIRCRKLGQESVSVAGGSLLLLPLSSLSEDNQHLALLGTLEGWPEGLP